MTRLLRKFLPVLLGGLLLAGAAFDGPARAGGLPVNTGGTGHAIKGYDAVAYFTEGAPREGRAEFSYEWMDATWLFASAAHRDAFAADPERYAPQFGGYCAYAVAKGNPAPADPNIWAIVDDKLYLNLSPGVQEKWEADRQALIVAAREKWPGMESGTGKLKAKAKGDR
ncbi:MAG TPA: YHS domain-containing (seleno)protein [Thermohalobaculum sp.]|nr:YHS domain-containing (seleno)protein [Thermohalobaculum sp.]